mmetsp:Transcript_631/g.1492  ORF Transcript_631/g.1492 Transcript_631/m.1492 type:complete len:105 (+) Transcript_631:587-901(+)
MTSHAITDILDHSMARAINNGIVIFSDLYALESIVHLQFIWKILKTESCNAHKLLGRYLFSSFFQRHETLLPKSTSFGTLYDNPPTEGSWKRASMITLIFILVP